MHKKSNDSKLDEAYKNSLKFSILDGAFFSLMMGFGEYYLSAYILLLGATSFEIGIFGTLPAFFASVVQIWAPNLMHHFRSRKKTILAVSWVRTIIWLAIIFAWLMKSISVEIVTLATSIYFSMIFIGSVPWTSWMGDLVDDKERNRYFAVRNRISTAMMVIGIVIGGIILQYFENQNLTGFIIIFIAAFIFSAASVLFLSKKQDVLYIENLKDELNLKEFTRNITKNNFGKFTIYNTILNFALYIASPFFIAYQIKILNMNYIEIMVAQAAFLSAKVLFFKAWGIVTDKYGNVKVLSLSTILVSLLPFLWFYAHTAVQVYLINIFSGIAWAGFELLAFNYIYENVEPQKIGKFTSYMTFYKGFGILLGGLAGTILFFNNTNFSETFFGILFISGFFRIISSIYFMREVSGNKDHKPWKYGGMMFELLMSAPKEGLNIITVFTRKKK